MATKLDRDNHTTATSFHAQGSGVSTSYSTDGTDIDSPIPSTGPLKPNTDTLVVGEQDPPSQLSGNNAGSIVPTDSFRYFLTNLNVVKTTYSSSSESEVGNSARNGNLDVESHRASIYGKNYGSQLVQLGAMKKTSLNTKSIKRGKSGGGSNTEMQFIMDTLSGLTTQVNEIHQATISKEVQRKDSLSTTGKSGKLSIGIICTYAI